MPQARPWVQKCRGVFLPLSLPFSQRVPDPGEETRTQLIPFLGLKEGRVEAEQPHWALCRDTSRRIHLGVMLGPDLKDWRGFYQIQPERSIKGQDDVFVKPGAASCSTPNPPCPRQDVKSRNGWKSWAWAPGQAEAGSSAGLRGWRRGVVF